MTDEPQTARPKVRRQRPAGIRSREAILREATRLVTVEGIEGLSIGRLAEAAGMSKSGLFAHFRSKEELQLATIETADAIFRAEVVEPAFAARPGAARLRALADAFLDHVARDVFPGGCFFASVSAEIDTHPGPVRDRALASVSEWFALLEAEAREAQTRGEIVSDVSAAQIAFEIHAFLLLANAQYLAVQDSAALEPAHSAIDRLLTTLAPARV